MRGSDADIDLSSRLKSVLRCTENPLSYGTLARDLKVTGPSAIARITTALEGLMRDDAAAGRPFLAAMCEGKLSGGLPALGFFQLASALGRYAGPATGPEAAAFVKSQRDVLAQDGH